MTDLRKLSNGIYNIPQKMIKWNDSRASLIYAAKMTLLFEGIARIIQVRQPIIETYYDPGRLLKILRTLQNECHRQTSKILTEFTKHRGIQRKIQSMNEFNRSKPRMDKTDKLDPKCYMKPL